MGAHIILQVSGEYFKNKKISSRRLTDGKLEKELWEISERLVNTSFL